MDVAIGEMDEHARVHITRRINVQIASAACDASLYVLAVVLEIEREDSLACAPTADGVIHRFALLRATEQMIIDPMEQLAKDDPAQIGLSRTRQLRSEISCYVGCLLAGYAQWRFEGSAQESLDDVAVRVCRMTAGFADTFFD